MSKPHVFLDRLQEKAILVVETTCLSLTGRAKARYPPDTRIRPLDTEVARLPLLEKQ